MARVKAKTRASVRAIRLAARIEVIGNLQTNRS